MYLNFSEKIFTFFHQLIEKKYHLKKLSKVIKNKANFKKPIVFDVGGNEGESIDFFLKLFVNSKIYSFEPETKSYRKLTEKYKNNKKINLYNFAFGNKKKKMNLKLNIKSSTSTLAKINKQSKYYNLKSLILNRAGRSAFTALEEVQVDKLDNFCNKKKITSIDILKIDTEGFELSVIQGAKKTLKKTKLLIIEFQLNDMYLNYSSKKIETFLKFNNFIFIDSLKFPFMQYEDRVYMNKNIEK